MAFASSVVWECRSTGSDNNGGAFDPTSGVPGTDFSQQDAAQIAYTDMVIGATTTQFTSVANSPAASLVGNFINITSGVNFTVQRVQVLSVAAGVATCDKSLGTAAATGGHGNMGGGLATPTLAFSLMVAKNALWIKASASYTITTTITISLNFSGAGPSTTVTGYTAARGDGGQATITTATNSVNLFTFESGSTIPQNWLFQNLIFSCTAGTPGSGWIGGLTGSTDPQNIMAKNCKWTGWSIGINVDFNTTLGIIGLVLINCEVTACTSHGIVASATTVIKYSFIHGNTGDGFRVGSGSTENRSPNFFVHTIFKSNGGNGFNNLSGGVTQRLQIFQNCAFINNTGAGVLFSTEVYLSMDNCILDSNGTYGINLSGGNPAEFYDANSNAYWNNTSGARNGAAAGVGDVTLSGDPFVNRSSNNFALNSTGGAGLVCRAAGFPGVLTIGGTGFEDIGPLQHADSGTVINLIGGSAAGMSTIMAM